MDFLIILKLVTEAIGAICKLIGELWWHNAQRYIMPVCYCIAITIIEFHVKNGAWWLGLTVLPMIAPLVMGYKTYGPSDGFDRAVWLMLVGLAAGLGPTLSGHESWFAFVPITIVCAIWGGVTRAWLNTIIAPISGILVLSHIWFIH